MLKFNDETLNLVVIVSEALFFLTWTVAAILCLFLTLFSCFVIWPWTTRKNGFTIDADHDFWFAWRPVTLNRFCGEHWPSIRWLCFVKRTRSLFMMESGPIYTFTYESL